MTKILKKNNSITILLSYDELFIFRSAVGGIYGKREKYFKENSGLTENEAKSLFGDLNQVLQEIEVHSLRDLSVRSTWDPDIIIDLKFNKIFGKVDLVQTTKNKIEIIMGVKELQALKVGIEENLALVDHSGEFSCLVPAKRETAVNLLNCMKSVL